MAKKQKTKHAADGAAMEQGRRALLKFIKHRRQFKNREATDRAKRLVIFESNHRKLVSAPASKRQFDIASFDREVQRDWENLLKDAARQQKEASGRSPTRSASHNHEASPAVRIQERQSARSDLHLAGPSFSRCSDQRTNFQRRCV